jgi:hypothetical protein
MVEVRRPKDMRNNQVRVRGFCGLDDCWLVELRDSRHYHRCTCKKQADSAKTALG